MKTYLIHLIYITIILFIVICFLSGIEALEEKYEKNLIVLQNENDSLLTINDSLNINIEKKNIFIYAIDSAINDYSIKLYNIEDLTSDESPLEYKNKESGEKEFFYQTTVELAEDIIDINNRLE